MKYILYIIAVLFLVEIVGLAKLKLSVNQYENYWKKGNERALNPNEILYIALGDSASQGIGATSPRKGFVGVIAEYIQDKTGKTVHTINLSKTGAKLDDVIKSQLPAIDDYPVDEKTILTIDIGANDMKTFNAVKFESELDKILSQLPKQTIIANVPYFGSGRLRSLEPNALEANVIYSRLANKYSLQLVDLHAVTKSQNQIWTFAPDWFHPGNIGYRNWFDAYKGKLEL